MLDVQTIENKSDIGVYYAITKGLADVENAKEAMEAYDRDGADFTLSRAKSLIDGYAANAFDGVGDMEFTARLVRHPPSGTPFVANVA